MLACVICSLAVCLSANAVDEQPDRDLFIDTEFGFELLVPTGWRYDRTRVPGSDGSFAIGTGLSPDGKQYVQIFAYQGFRVTDFDAWVKGYERQFAAMNPIMERDKKSGTVQARPAVTLKFEYLDGETRKQAEHLLIMRDPMSILAITTGGPADAPRDPRAAIERLSASVMFVSLPVKFHEMDEAFRRGRNLLAVLRKHAEEVRVPEDDAVFLTLLDGKPTGYFARRLSSERRNMKNLADRQQSAAGIRYFEQSWTFSPDGTARHEALDMFATRDGASSLGEFRVVQIPPKDSPFPPLIRLDEVIRERDALFSSRTRNLEKDLPTPQPPIRLDANYLPHPWIILLPGFLVDVEDETHAFTVYDSETRALRPLIITSRGAESEEDGLFAFDVRHSFDGPVTRMITDEFGRLQSAKTGVETVQRTTRARVDTLFATQEKAAQKRVFERKPVEQKKEGTTSGS